MQQIFHFPGYVIRRHLCYMSCFLISLLLMFLATNCYAQHTPPVPYSGNFPVSYIRTWDAIIPETNSANITTAATPDKFRMATQYIDGLGRPIQTVIKQGSLITGGTVTDMTSAIEYDEFGREQYKYLPSPANNTGGNTSITDGLFKLNPFQQQAAFYSGFDPNINPIKGQGETYFYSQVNFEPSPLNRVQESFAPGNSWVGTAANAPESARKSVKAKYYINSITDGVRIWNVTNNATPGNWGSYASPGTYLAGVLYKNITVDENNKQVIEFKDKEGKVILKKVQLTATADDGTGSNHTGWLCTYYLYDDLNNLRCVVQPRGVELIPAWTLTDATILSEQCFRYEYDERNRMIMKKVPGAGEVNMVYDKRDRLVMLQDGNMKTGTAKWLVTKYDVLNRPIETGLWTNAITAATHRTNAANLAGELYEYPNTSSGYELLTKTHYDDYTGVPAPLTGTLNATYITSPTFITTYNAAPDYAQKNNVQSMQTKGMVTWTQVKVLGTASQFISQVNFYDDKGRIIQVQSVNQTGGTDIATTQYDFSGKVLRTHLLQQKSITPVQSYQLATKNSYDVLGRIITIEKNINNLGYKKISAMEYDALGQLKKKSLGTAPLETLVYDYNIRGWLLGVNRDYTRDANNTNYFGFDLGYDKINNNLIGGKTYAAAQYNGNIAGTVWKSKGDGEKRKYDFGYDPVNRLMKADFNQYTSGDFNKTANVDFSIQVGDGALATSAYDANGNFITMTQSGLKLNTSGTIDLLIYKYITVGTIPTNKLSKVSDAIVTLFNGSLGDFKDGSNGTTDDYDYDPNGNLILDNNKKISSITYNHLNLPSVITVTGKGTITYTYDAAGNKQKKETVDNSTTGKTITSTTTYVNGFVYESKKTVPVNTPNDDYTDKLQFTGHEEGRIRKNADGTFAYDYFIKDHLGNVRMVLTEETNPASIYQAGMEDANRSNETLLFNNIPETVTSNNKPSGFDADGNNKNVSQLFSSSAGDKRIGPGVVLKVMAGDKFNAKVMGWYLPGANASTYSGATSIVTALINALGGGLVGAGSKGTFVDLSSPTGVLSNPLTSFMNDPTRPNISSIPKAYLNWMVLDEEQFKLVQGSNGAVQVPVITGTGQKQLMQANNGSDIPITKNGYLYVYVSNESQGNVYFDDIRVEHTRGPVLEETHYYPFGLSMSGISSKSAGSLTNRIKYNGKELNNNEFSDGSGLEAYDFGARMQDPQIGRWWQIDPLSDQMRRFSPYNYAFDNPIRFIDKDGMKPYDWVQYNNGNGQNLVQFVPSVTNNQQAKEWAEKQGYNNGTDIGLEATVQGFPATENGAKTGASGEIHLNSNGTYSRLDDNSNAVAANDVSNEGKPSVTKEDKANSEPSNTSTKVADILDKSMIATDAVLQGSQKLSNIGSDFKNAITKLDNVPFLGAVGKLASGAVAGHQIYQGITDPKHHWVQGLEGVGSLVVAIAFPQFALTYALVTLSIDLIMEANK